MARNFYDIVSNARLRLGDPRAQAPNDSQLLLQALSHTRTIKRAKRNSSNPWEFGETVVEITPDEGVYQISAADFGTPLCVQTVPQNANDTPRLVPFYCPQNLAFSWGLPANAGSFLYTNWTGSSANALRCAIFWQNNLPYIQFEPTPALSPASYLVKFLKSASGVNVLAMAAEPLPDEDVDVVEIRTAKSTLSLAEWDSPATRAGQQRNTERRKDLFVTLNDDERLAYEQFLIANRITSGPRLGVRWSVCGE